MKMIFIDDHGWGNKRLKWLTMHFYYIVRFNNNNYFLVIF